MAAGAKDSTLRREMKVLALGLPRTGSASMCQALEQLGYHEVYHGVKAIDSIRDWEFFNRAADATFPVLPSYTGKPLTRDDWEELYGPYEAVTDTASVFAPQLIKAYPDAKVVLVIRDFDPWLKSIDEGVLQALWSTAASISVSYVEPLLGSFAGLASRKLMLGFFEARDVDEARRNARMAYDRHHRQIRAAVPPGQLLEYRMGDGWGPLCEFLGRPVPEGEFPWVNEAAALKEAIRNKMISNARAALVTVLPWLAGAGAVGVGSWVTAQKAGIV